MWKPLVAGLLVALALTLGGCGGNDDGSYGGKKSGSFQLRDTCKANRGGVC